VCHSVTAIMQRFLFRAQDRNMTNGDYAFFTFSSLYRASYTEQPWSAYDMENEVVQWRIKAFYSLKQVRPQCAVWLLLRVWNIFLRNILSYALGLHLCFVSCGNMDLTKRRDRLSRDFFNSCSHLLVYIICCSYR